MTKEIKKDSNEILSQMLGTCLASATVMYHRVHGFHWNVVGPDFPQWHDKFAEIYEDVYGSLDPLAENIRKVSGRFAPFRLADLASRSVVNDNVITDFGSDTLVKDLLVSNEAVLELLQRTFDVATAANQQGVANFIAERIDAHQKWNWQLRVSAGSR